MILCHEFSQLPYQFSHKIQHPIMNQIIFLTRPITNYFFSFCITFSFYHLHIIIIFIFRNIFFREQMGKLLFFLLYYPDILDQLQWINQYLNHLEYLKFSYFLHIKIRMTMPHLDFILR